VEHHVSHNVFVIDLEQPEDVHIDHTRLENHRPDHHQQRACASGGPHNHRRATEPERNDGQNQVATAAQ
jgi:hypothetical protein